MKPIILVRSINLLKAKQNCRVAYNIFNAFCILSFGNRCFKPFFPQDIEEYETVKVAVRAFSCAHEEYCMCTYTISRNKFEHYFSTTITSTRKRYNI